MTTQMSPLKELLANAGSEAVALCGSGVSACPPSSIPSWYGMNIAALEGVKQLVLDQPIFQSSAVRDSISEISLEKVPITSFSQIIADAFSGREWLSILKILDGKQTNAIHRELAGLLIDRTCHSVITTNFDTLIERACNERGYSIPVYGPGDSWPQSAPDGALYKIHGSVTDHETIMDLMIDKRRGLSPALRHALADMCANRHLMVMGFSGADLEIHPDYLGILSAPTLPARVTWTIRPGSKLTTGAHNFLDRLSARGVPAEVQSWDLLELAGRQDPASFSTARADENDLKLFVAKWLNDNITYIGEAAAALISLVTITASRDIAAAARSELRQYVRQSPGRLIDVPYKAMSLMQLGSIEITVGEFDLAIRDFNTASDLIELFESRIAKDQNSEQVVRDEVRWIRATLMQNTAVLNLLQGGAHAKRGFDDLRRLAEDLQSIPGLRAQRRLAGVNYNIALSRLLAKDLHGALVSFESSYFHASASGDVQQEAGALKALALCLRKVGEVELGEIIDTHAIETSNFIPDPLERGYLQTPVDQFPAANMLSPVEILVEQAPAQDLWMGLAAATQAGDPLRRMQASAAVLKRDATMMGGARLGQALLSFALICNSTAQDPEYFTRTILDIVTTGESSLSNHARFLLQITIIGNEQSDEFLTLPKVEHLQSLRASSDLGRAALLSTMWIFKNGLSRVGFSAAHFGVEAFAEGNFSAAVELFRLGHESLLLAGHQEEAVRAALYGFDALWYLHRETEAEGLLDALRPFCTRSLKASFLSRLLYVVGWKGKDESGKNKQDAVTAIIDIVDEIVQLAPGLANRALIQGASEVIQLGNQNKRHVYELIDRVNPSELNQSEREAFEKVRTITADLES